MAAATLTAAEFLVSFREFANANAAMVAAKVAEANRMVDASVWGDVANDGAGYLAAEMLAQGQFGKDAQMEPDRYRALYQRLLDSRVLLCVP